MSRADADVAMRRFVAGSVVGLAVLVALHVTTPTSRALHDATAAASLLEVWLGIKLTYG